jgi:energy-coupling factor transport system ATP-binding protein
MTTAIAAEDLTFRYAGRKRPCLRDVTFAIAPGETVLVLGPSGCGKSTLALCLNGLIPHVIEGELSGHVRVAGRDTRDCPLAMTTRDVGMLFQDPDTQFCMLRVDDEVAFGLENLRLPRAEMAGRISAALWLAGLDCPLTTRIDTLSGGNKQRLALACVLAMQPQVLVFDEPTSHLDPWSAQNVVAMIQGLKAGGEHTVILIEHRLDHLMGLIDRVLLLGPDGVLLADGEPRRLLRDQAAVLDQFGIWIPQVSELAGSLQQRGVAVEPYPLTIAEAAASLAPLAAGGLPFANRVRLPASAEPRVRREQAISVRGLSYRYQAGPAVLHDIRLDITAGDFVAVVGPNGAGKSTLAQHIAGILQPPPGTVFLGERDLRALRQVAIATLVGYVFQNPEHQFVTTSVFDELAFGLRLRDLPEAGVRGRVEEMLTGFGLGQLARANPFRLSQGEKRRLSVATMLILGQEVLVLDEPTVGQDRRNAGMLLSICERLHREGKTIVMITHDMRLVAEHARTVIVLVEGRVAFTGSPAELFADAVLVARAHLEPPPMLELSRLLFDKKGGSAPPAEGAFLPFTIDMLAAALAPTPLAVAR